MYGTTVVVGQDRGRFKRQAGLVLPVAIPAILFLTLKMARGRGTSEGMHAAAVPAMLALVGLPLVWYMAHSVLSVRNAAILVRDGEAEVRRWTGRSTRLGRLSIVWHLGIDSSGTGAPWYLLAGPDGAVVLNAKHWTEEGMQEVCQAAGLIMTKGGRVKAKELGRRYPGLRMPRYVRFPGLIVPLWFVGSFLYIGVVVNVFARL